MVVAGPEADVARRRIVEFGLVGRRAIAGFRAVEAVVRIIRIAQAEIDAERMGQGHVGTDRQFKFAIDFPDLDPALRFENPFLLSSEECRVGEEGIRPCRCWWSRDNEKKKK